MTKAEIISYLLTQAEAKKLIAECNPDSTFDQDAKALHEAAELVCNAPAVDVVPMCFHERCLAMEIHRRIEAENAVPHWIDVNVRLPEKNEDVVVVIRAGISYRYRVAYMRDGYWIQGGGRLIYDEVTHWMPLPVPPMENEGGRK